MISEIQRHMTISLHKVTDEDEVTDALTEVNVHSTNKPPPYLVIARTNMISTILQQVTHYIIPIKQQTRLPSKHNRESIENTITSEFDQIWTTVFIEWTNQWNINHFKSNEQYNLPVYPSERWIEDAVCLYARCHHREYFSSLTVHGLTLEQIRQHMLREWWLR